MQDFIPALKDFVNKEQDTQNQQVEGIWRLPLEQRVAEGEAIANVRIEQVETYRLKLSFPENLSKFRPSDTLRLHRGDPADEDASTICEVEEELNGGMVVLRGYGQDFSDLIPGNGWILDRNLVDVRFIQLNILNQIASSPSLQERFESLVEGRTPPEMDAARVQQAANMAGQWGFNRSQREAFANAFGAENYALIQGPPGTGKTWVLAHLAAELAKEGQNVLITAFTHRAINNALRKIVSATDYPQVIKVGQRKYAEDLGPVPNFENFIQSPYFFNPHGVIVGGTCFAVRTKRLMDVAFDTVIFDEAGQMPLPLAFAGMLSGRKAIFIGDHQQMPPIITAEHSPEWVKKSIFEVLFETAPGTMLDTTYRMNQAINAFPSRNFYHNKLKTAPSARSRKLQLKSKPTHFAEILDPEIPEVFVEIAHSGRGMRSPEEAEIAAGLALEAVKCGLPAQEIAIVAPYRAQGRLIRQRLREMAEEQALNGIQDIVVDTVERIQGQERDLVILSLTTSSPQHAAERAAFYFQPNRLNVSITRARVKRIVLGSPDLFQVKVNDPQLQAWADNFKELYRHSTILHAQPLNLDS